MRQGNDVGTQYRSAIYCFAEEQRRAADRGRAEYETALAPSGFGHITTEILDAPAFYYAEDITSSTWRRIPGGYCGLGGTGYCST